MDALRSLPPASPARRRRSYGTIEVYVPEREPSMGLIRGFASVPVLLAFALLIFTIGWAALRGPASGFCLTAFIITALAGVSYKLNFAVPWSVWYDELLKNSLPFSVLTAVAVFIGGLVQIIPTIILNKAEQIEGVRQVPYTALELAGRDIHVREGCYNCHSQMVRTLVGDVLRYGEYSKLGESIYDHPYQWGSKRTGPDLAREGGKYPSIWHYHHMRDPRQISPGSTMPNYPWLLTDQTDFRSLPRKVAVQRKLGVPFPEMTKQELQAAVTKQGQVITDDLRKAGAEVAPDREIVALIAYLQKLGRSEEVKPRQPEPAKPVTPVAAQLTSINPAN